VKFKEKVKPVADLFVPVFFVMAGAMVDLSTITNTDVIIAGLMLTAIAIVGKMASGLGCIGSKAGILPVGIGMVPRGEVGLIFASFGLTHHLIKADMYSILIIAIMLTTLITPPLLMNLMGKNKEPEKKESSKEKESKKDS
jgi:Kef-type K+ transport system membrane component KefB